MFGALGISGLATGPGPPGYGFASSTYRSGPDPVADPPSYHRGVPGSLGGSGVVGGIVVLHLCLAQGFVSLLGCGSDSRFHPWSGCSTLTSVSTSRPAFPFV